jgi:hypothetical protein
VEIELKKISVRELAEDYQDDAELGVRAFGGKLDVRPPYQREFVYKDKQRDAVIATLRKDFPLNVMYWSVRGDGTYEIIDGQQRTISICQFVEGDFSFEDRYFHNLQDDEKAQVLDYELMVYLCSGTDSERLDWFRTINIAGEELTDQELRNAVYAGPWVTDAKKYFSKSGCPAYGLGSDYMSGTPIRQDYLERVIDWISEGTIEGYMAKRQHKLDAQELWEYFQKVIAWAQETFPIYRSEMQRVPWGPLYNTYKDADLDPEQLEKDVAFLMSHDDVTNNAGIYSYALDGNERHVSVRQFTKNQRRRQYEKQNWICPLCSEEFDLDDMDADHVEPWSKGGRTIDANLQMLCRPCNIKKSNARTKSKKSSA